MRTLSLTFDVLALAGAGLAFLLPQRFPMILWLPIGLVWLLSIGACWPDPNARAAGIIGAAIAATATLGLVVSSDPALSAGKFAGIIFSALLFWSIVTHWDEKHYLDLTADVIALLSMGVAAVGIVGTAWFPSKIARLTPIYQHLPHLLPTITSSFGTPQPGIQPNELGGTLALLLPATFTFTLFTSSGLRRRFYSFATILGIAVALLSQSRASLTGIALAILFTVALRLGKTRWLILGLPPLLVGAVLLFGIQGIEHRYLSIDQATGSSTLGRLEVWQRAVHLIADFPYTGIGLNTFPNKIDLLYPVYSTGDQIFIPHAHDLYLQTALDLGIAGLIIFLAITGLALIGIFRAWPVALANQRVLIAGLGAGLTAFLTSQTLDAVSLGAKPSPVLFAFLGLAVAVGSELGPPPTLWAVGTTTALAVALLGGPFLLGDGAPVQAMTINRLNLAIVADGGSANISPNGVAGLRHDATRLRPILDGEGNRSGPLLYALARTEQQAKLDDDALGDFTRASDPARYTSSSDPRLFEARAQEGLLLIAHGKSDDGVEALQSALTLISPAIIPQDRARLHIVVGQTVWQQHRDLAGLESNFDAAVQLDPSVHWPYHQLITMALDRKDLLSAQRWVTRLESVSPGDTWTYFFAGRVAYESNNRQAALQAFAASIRADPNNEQPEFWAGVTDQSLGRWPDAVAHFQRAIAINPKNPSYQQYLDNSLRHLGATGESSNRPG